VPDAGSRHVQVALDVPLDRLFDYRNVDATEADVGRRVQVPFGRSRATGIIAGLSDRSDVPPAQLNPDFPFTLDLRHA